MSRYNSKAVEAKWQKIWDERQAFRAETDPGRPKYYVLEMFPYPSGRIHMGHVRNYTLGDVVARYKRARGFNVLHPMGWDAFGLPAENAAQEKKVHPAAWTYDNIATMRGELQRMGLSLDWSREIATCHPGYYRHQQKLFLDLLKKDLAYRRESFVNWDPIDNTVLANAAQALRNLSKQHGARPQLVAQGILPPILALCHSCPEGKVVVQAAGGVTAMVWRLSRRNLQSWYFLSPRSLTPARGVQGGRRWETWHSGRRRLCQSSRVPDARGGRTRWRWINYDARLGGEAGERFYESPRPGHGRTSVTEGSGHTELAVRPEEGMAVVHFPSTVAQSGGITDYNAYHESEAAEDEKWVAQQFIWSHARLDWRRVLDAENLEPEQRLSDSSL